MATDSRGGYKTDRKGSMRKETENNRWIRIAVITIVVIAALAAGATSRLYGGGSAPASDETRAAEGRGSEAEDLPVTPTPALKAPETNAPTPTLPPRVTPTPEPLAWPKVTPVPEASPETAAEAPATAEESAEREKQSYEEWKKEWEARYNRRLSVGGQILMAVLLGAAAAACWFLLKASLSGRGTLFAVAVLLAAAYVQHLVCYVLNQYAYDILHYPFVALEMFLRFDVRVLAVFTGAYLALRERTGAAERIACAIPMTLLVWTLISIPADLVIAPYSNPPATIPGDMQYEAFFLLCAILLRVHMRGRIRAGKQRRRAERRAKGRPERRNEK